MKIKIEDLKPLRLYGTEGEGSTLSLKVGKPTNGGTVGIDRKVSLDGNG